MFRSRSGASPWVSANGHIAHHIAHSQKPTTKKTHLKGDLKSDVPFCFFEWLIESFDDPWTHNVSGNRSLGDFLNTSGIKLNANRKAGHCNHCHNFAAFLPILRKSGVLQTYPTYLESVNQVSSYVEIQLIIYIYQYLGMGDIIKEIPSQKSQNKSLRIHTK